MKKVRVFPLLFTCLLLAVCAAGAVSDPQDRKGGKDHPVFTRMPDFYIDRYEAKKFDSYVFREKRRTFAVEGRFYRISYCMKSGSPPPGDAQILRTYTNAAIQAGGVVTAADDKDAFFKVSRAGMETWVHVHPWGRGKCYSLTIVERQAPLPDASADAGQMLRDIQTTGKTALYGIYFDSERAGGIKPESEPTLREIAKFLRENPSVKVYVVGHTDSSGDILHNQKISEARAQAVVMELIAKYHIAENRLKGFGAGPLSPVASNATNDGRARNRRVELVEQ